jgi:hypothetical protein
MTIQATGSISFIQSVARLAYRPETSTGGTVLGGNATANSAAVVTVSAAARQLAAQDTGYDFTNMTPNQMKSLGQDLLKAGKIDPAQLFELENAGVPLGRLGVNGEFVPLSADEKARYASTPVNYVRTAQNVIQFKESSGEAVDPKSTIKEWQGLLRLMQELQGQPASQNLGQYHGVAIPMPSSYSSPAFANR